MWIKSSTEAEPTFTSSKMPQGQIIQRSSAGVQQCVKLPPTATNLVLNDILVEIGSRGIKKIWPELFTYPKENQVKTIEVLGKSLGGAHAQELALFIEGTTTIKVSKLTTFSSIGVGRNINELFKTKVLKSRQTPFIIQVI